MAKRIRYSPEQIITKLREAEVHLSQGKTVGQACKALEISEQTYYRWRREYGGMDVTQARKLKDGCHPGPEAQRDGKRKYPAEEIGRRSLFG